MESPTIGSIEEEINFDENTPIDFEFELKNYVVHMNAWRTNRIKLPDGRVLKAGIWFEVFPPLPLKLEVIEDNRKGIAIATYVSEVVL